MRALLLTPLLLTGCALLAPVTSTFRTTHDGYELTCVDVPLAECERQAEEAADLLDVAGEGPVTSITIDANGVAALCTRDGCWDD